MGSLETTSRPHAVYHGPINIGGIGGYLAKRQRARGVRSDCIVYSDFTPQQNADRNLHLERVPRVLRWLLKCIHLLRCLFRYDLFHFYFGQSLLPLNLDLPLLKLCGKKIVMSYCGSDIRLVKVEETWNPYAHLLRIGADHPKFDRRKRRMMAWQKVWIDQFTALRNLHASAITVLPESRVRHDVWLGNAVDLPSLDVESLSTKSVPTIVHAPTERGIKGTVYLEKALERLRERGYRFNYRPLERVSNGDVRRICRDEADIIVDQLLIGAFGIFSTEGMAFGKPVCCYIIEDARDRYFPDCPIVNANIDNIAEKLAWLIDHPEERVRLGKEGRAYAEKYCDRTKVSEQVWSLYVGLWEPQRAGVDERRGAAAAPASSSHARLPARL